ncbi:hypothetical protein BUALT_Bualt09G0117700 [Buddleja alternifolia]|uniref:Protein kinase domain-containing protein n=1 Tax=Buddleja alternifolia TaxID=168488 RepID=A0AAV6X396_9LAMI|nr:hypothetical protein BUALT_Bualt09G0117700 [Buddleja alternifolia]
MAQPVRRHYAVGDYMVGKQIGAGSFSTVWHARHRVHGTEVAIKEIAMARLNSKLQDSLKSEIFILKRINHPNIIRLHDMIEESGKMYIVLEYCRGGDLSMYIQQRQGRIPEETAKHFMQQLAEGLKILRENNLIHRDLKPQNLLLSTNGDDCILKIADFGFASSELPLSSARSLQPRGLAETLCGSPLYMAPEIMQLQKYDAKADLWSVGAILFQLVTGKTPFTGNNQIQLLQNIIKSTELQFPPEAKDLNPHCIDLCKKLLRRNPEECLIKESNFEINAFTNDVTVERLTFEEFFNHPYLVQRQPEESFRNRQPQRVVDSFPLSEKNTEENSQEDCLPFSLDVDSSGPDGSPSLPRWSTMRSTYGFSLDTKPDQKDLSHSANRTDSSKYGSVPHKPEIIRSSLGSRRLSEGNLKESLKTKDLGLLDNRPKVMDSLESIEQEYVIVSGPPLDISSLPRASKPSHFPSKTGSPPFDSGIMNSIPSAPVPITDGVGYSGSLESRISAPGTSQGSMDIADTSEHPSTDSVTRIKSLQRCASAITELVNDKIEAKNQLEAFSLQLVILAIWKQALDICHTRAASAIEGSPRQEPTRLREKVLNSPDVQVSSDIANTKGPLDICSQIERAFLHEVGNAEELAKVIEPGNMEMPDAMELIYQSALALGKRGAVEEYMGDTESGVIFYSKAVRLLVFLLVEAPSLILNPPFSLTNSDRYRIQNYIDLLNNRQSVSRSQRMVLFKAEDQPCPS